jgi:myo-inositol catabolism protein IolS
VKYTNLGNSDLKVSAMAFGAWQIGDPKYWGPDDEADGVAAVGAAIDAGINFFDTAEGYGDGESEKALGRALGDRRSEVVIASKVSPTNCAPDKLRASCEASLERLGTDFLDLYQVHWPPRDVHFEDTYAALVRLREEGKIRAIGVSNFGKIDLPAWLDTGDCVSNQLGYNLLFRSIEFDVVPLCLENNIGIMAYMPLLQGILAGKYATVDDIPEARRRTRHFSRERSGTRHDEDGCEDLTIAAIAGIGDVANEIGASMADVAIAWTMAQPAVASVLVGARNPKQVQRNAAAADLDLDDATIAKLNAMTDPIKNNLGPRIDMWESEANSRAR